MAANSKFLFRLELNFAIFAEKFGSDLQISFPRRNPAAGPTCGTLYPVLTGILRHKEKKLPPPRPSAGITHPGIPPGA